MLAASSVQTAPSAMSAESRLIVAGAGLIAGLCGLCGNITNPNSTNQFLVYLVAFGQVVLIAPAITLAASVLLLCGTEIAAPIVVGAGS
ncbi:MAG TPA: hypothetical protein VGM78_08470, partial [Ilumatobacteraceae bacterium]